MKKITVFLLFLCALLSACTDQSESPARSPQLIFNHVIPHHTVMSIGIDYNTNKAIILDPLDGNIIQPCKQSRVENTYSKAPMQNTNPECNNEIVDDNSVIQNVLNITRESPTIPIKVRKANGSIVDGIAIVSVNIIYPGSHCQSYYSGGKKTTDCTRSEKRYCKKIEPAKDIATEADKQKCQHYWST